MLIPAPVWEALIAAGVDLLPCDAGRVELRLGEDRAHMTVHMSPRPLSPSDITALVSRLGGEVLLIVPGATAAATGAAQRAGWSWLIVDGHGVHGLLKLAARDVRIGAESPGRDHPPSARSGRPAWGSLAVVRRLIQQPAASQRVLASLSGVSQPRVSQVLTDLAELDLAVHTRSGWMVRDFDRLVDWWLARYPGHGGISTYWYGLEPPQSQAFDVLRLAQDRPAAESPFAVVSGDVGADLIAPWRTPTRGIVYVRAGIDLAAAGFTPAGAQEATLELIVPKDPGIWPAPSPDVATHTADPLQVLWDVQRSPGPDRTEAAARLREVLRERAGFGHAGRFV